jgi:hypothetical protein
MNTAGLIASSIVVFILTQPAFAIESISNLSRRYSDCSKLRPDHHASAGDVSFAEKQRSRAYLACLLQPLTPESQNVCDTTGDCETVGLFRAISMIHESIDGNYSLQTPIQETQKNCNYKTSLLPSRRLQKALEAAGYEIPERTPLNWTELCSQNQTLVAVVDILTNARLKQTPKQVIAGSPGEL